jgi:hypothetical protein
MFCPRIDIVMAKHTHNPYESQTFDVVFRMGSVGAGIPGFFFFLIALEPRVE